MKKGLHENTLNMLLEYLHKTRPGGVYCEVLVYNVEIWNQQFGSKNDD